MKPVSQLSRGFRAVFDDEKSVPFAGLVIPLRLADRLGIRDAVNVRVTGMDRRRRRNSGDKTLNVVAMLLAGGDFLSDVNMLRSGATLRRLGYRWFSESRLGEWLRSLTDTDLAGFADALTETTATAWDFGFGPDLSNNSKSDPLIIDVDGTVTETYGRTKVGTGAKNYKGIHGYHPMLAVEAATGQIITTMLRPGNTSPANSVNEFTRDTLRRVRRLVGDSAALCLRADSGFYLRELFDLCQQFDTRFSVTVRQHKPVQQLITDIANDQWHKVDHGPQHRIDIAAVVFHIKGRHSNSRPPIPCRLIVRRVTTPADTGQPQPRLFDLTDHHAFVTDQPGDPETLWHRHNHRAVIETTIRDLKHGLGLNHFPSASFTANTAWLHINALTHNLARHTTQLLTNQPITTKTLRYRYLTIPGRITTGSRTTTLHLPTNWPWQHHLTQALTTLTAA